MLIAGSDGSEGVWVWTMLVVETLVNAKRESRISGCGHYRE